MLELKGKLYTTVVGSFPYNVDRKLITAENWRTVKEILSTSLQALRFQLDAGIDFPSDGQFFEMIEMYAQPMQHAGFLNEKYEIVGSAEKISSHPSLRLEIELEKVAKKNKKGLRVPVTGPFTLSYRIKTGDKNLVEAGDIEGIKKVAGAIKNYVRNFDRALSGAIISIDEPVLPFVHSYPVSSVSKEEIRKILNPIFQSIRKNYSCMHVCGALASIKNLALSLNVQILDHEFQGTDNNTVYSKKELEENNKMLSYGILNTKQVSIESVGFIKKEIEIAAKRYGFENLLLSPDCGFGGWKAVKMPEKEKFEIIKTKLRNMVKARNEVVHRQ